MTPIIYMYITLFTRIYPIPMNATTTQYNNTERMYSSELNKSTYTIHSSVSDLTSTSNVLISTANSTVRVSGDSSI